MQKHDPPGSHQDLNRQSHEFFPELAAQGDLPRIQMVRGVLFDFDYTLAYRTRPLDESIEEGARNAEEYMRAQNMDFPPDFWQKIIEARLFAQEKSEEEREEHIADDAMSFLLQFFGYPASELDLTVLHKTVDIFYAPEMTAWQLYPHAIETLTTLREHRQYTGVITNYNCDRVFQRTIDFLGLRPYLDLCVTSASVEYRKPDKGIFDIAIQQWDILPYELVVVGDSLIHDIAGAIELGSLAVLTQFGSDAQTEFDNRQSSEKIEADAAINSLVELPEIISGWASA